MTTTTTNGAEHVFIKNNPTQSDYYRETKEAIALVSATAPKYLP